MNKPLVLVNKVNEVLFFSVRQVDWNNFDEWVEDRERKLQPGGKLSVNRCSLFVEYTGSPVFFKQN